LSKLTSSAVKWSAQSKMPCQTKAQWAWGSKNKKLKNLIKSTWRPL
jgi:hypothetical protein